MPGVRVPERRRRSQQDSLFGPKNVAATAANWFFGPLPESNRETFFLAHPLKVKRVAHINMARKKVWHARGG